MRMAVEEGSTYAVVGMQAHAIAVFQTMVSETLGKLTNEATNLGRREGSLRISCFDEDLGGGWSVVIGQVTGPIGPWEQVTGRSASS